MLKLVMRLVGAIQVVLGAGYLLFPESLLAAIGHSTPPPDLLYPLGMLSARFVAYGIGFLVASRNPAQHLLWIRLMALVQAIDLGVGLFYTGTGIVPLSLSAFPMFNALWIGLCTAFMRPSATGAA